MTELSLLRRGSSLADPAEQLRVLSGTGPEFDRVLRDHGLPILTARQVEVLQVNVGKLCNQTCRHCHVDAGPDRKEAMSPQVAAACLEVLERRDIATLDITGGAPEMAPVFRQLVDAARSLDRRIIDRCNLTILTAPGYEDLADYLAERRVEIIASLPCYLETNVDKQRGDRVFRRSIDPLLKLNELGYGVPDSDLILNLVYNPTGPSLPPDQSELEKDYRRELQSRFGIRFTQLFTITNLPISRFLDDLIETDRLATYQAKLVAAFNPINVANLMCRSTLSVDWRGYVYDCDFNQMLDLGSQAVGDRVDDSVLDHDHVLDSVNDRASSNTAAAPLHVRDLDDRSWSRLMHRPIVTRRHCFGCTAGAGSSCGGSLTAP